MSFIGFGARARDQNGRLYGAHEIISAAAWEYPVTRQVALDDLLRQVARVLCEADAPVQGLTITLSTETLQDWQVLGSDE